MLSKSFLDSAISSLSNMETLPSTQARFVGDLMTFFTGSSIISISTESLSPSNDKFRMDDNRSIILKYKDGSVAVINYFAVGSKSLPKEYMEVHFDNKSIVMEDYRNLKGYNVDIRSISTRTSQKGHLEELEILSEALKEKNSPWPIELWDMLQTTEVTLALTDI